MSIITRVIHQHVQSLQDICVCLKLSITKLYNNILANYNIVTLTKLMFLR